MFNMVTLLILCASMISGNVLGSTSKECVDRLKSKNILIHQIAELVIKHADITYDKTRLLEQAGLERVQHEKITEVKKKFDLSDDELDVLITSEVERIYSDRNAIASEVDLKIQKYIVMNDLKKSLEDGIIKSAQTHMQIDFPNSLADTEKLGFVVDDLATRAMAVIQIFHKKNKNPLWNLSRSAIASEAKNLIEKIIHKRSLHDSIPNWWTLFLAKELLETYRLTQNFKSDQESLNKKIEQNIDESFNELVRNFLYVNGTNKNLFNSEMLFVSRYMFGDIDDYKFSVKVIKEQWNPDRFYIEDSNDHKKRSLLFEAIRLNRLTLIQSLLFFGANPNIKDEFGITPLKLAQSAGQLNIVNALKNAGAIDYENRPLKKLKRWVVDELPLKLLRNLQPIVFGSMILGSFYATKDNLLSYVAGQEHRTATKVLSTLGANYTYEQFAKDLNYLGIESKIKNLLDDGLIDVKDYRFIELAAFRGNTIIIEELVNHGADVNARDPKSGTTALYEAVCQYNYSAVKKLLDLGADINIKYHSRFEIFDYTQQGSTIYEILIDALEKSELKTEVNNEN